MAEKSRTKTFSIKKSEEAEIYEFVNMQSKLSDSLIYLIQKEIAENGLRNLQEILPAQRTIASVKEMIELNKSVIKKEIEEVKQEEVQEVENSYEDLNDELMDTY